jgi:hypothetical protein
MAWDGSSSITTTRKAKCWDFVGNMYTRKPDSPTMAVWPQRYFRAYLDAWS